MTFRGFAWAACLFVTLLSPAAQAVDDLPWEEIYTENGVVVSRSDVEGTKLYAFKGDTVMDADIHRVMYVLLDNDHRIEWVNRLYINEVVEQRNDFDYVIYQAFDLPALFSSRDYVYHGRATRDASTGVVTLSMQSIEHDKAPETVGVRAELINSRYRLTPTDDGKTRVEVEIITDPKGMMPTWLVNMIQKDWPLDTLTNLRGQLDKPYTGEHALPGEEAAKPAAPAAEEPAEEPAAEEEATEAEPTEAPAVDKASGEGAAEE